MTSNGAISYILAQTQENIKFLRSAQQISAEDERDILAKLSAAPGFLDSLKPVPSAAPDNETNRTFSMPLPTISDSSAIKPTPPKMAALSRPPPPIPSSFLFQARALWGYNNDNEHEDLKFSQGDIIEIVDDKNPDWWKGRLRGKEGLFPASYAERLQPYNSEKPPLVSMNVPPPGNTYSSPYLPYQPPPPQNAYYGPPQSAPYPPYQGGPPPAQATAGPVVIAAESKKKHGLFQGSLGNTLAQSAAGGVGFGAGSAVGGGIINALF